MRYWKLHNSTEAKYRHNGHFLEVRCLKKRHFGKSICVFFHWKFEQTKYHRGVTKKSKA